MQRALLASALAALACAGVGAFVVFRGMGFLADSVAHSSLTGMAVAFLWGGNLFWGALAWVVPASLAISWISRRRVLRLDTAVGIIFVTGFALGLILMSRVSNFTAPLFDLLFGNVLGVSWSEVLLIGVVAGVVLAVIGLLFKELTFVSYDPTMAASAGIPVRFLEYLLPVLVGVTTVASLKVVGLLLVLALLITPAATAALLTRRLPHIMMVGLAVALLATLGGLYLSYYLDLPTGPSMAMIASGMFMLTLLFAPGRGVVWRSGKRAARVDAT